MPKIPRTKSDALVHTCAAKFKSGAKCLTRVTYAGDLCSKHIKTPKHVITGRYGDLKRSSIRERLAAIQKFENDPSDLLPEIELMRALIIDFAENYDEFVEALLAWNQTLEPGMRPVKIPELKEIGGMLETVGRLVARHHEIQNRGSISMEDFRRALSAMGSAVALHVTDERILRQIEDAWGNIALDSKRPFTATQKRLNAPAILEGELA